MSVDFLSKNFPPFQVHHAKKPPRFYPDGFQRNVIDFYFIFSDCRLRKALYLQFSYFIWPLSYTKKIFLKLDSNYSYKRYKEKVTYNFYDDKLEIIRKYDRTIIEWKNITCCNIKKNLCWLGYGNKGLVINGDEFSFGTEEQFITFIKNKNHININLE